jgi:hypothetical protein
MDGVEDNSTSHPPPLRPSSPLKAKPRKKLKASATQADGALSADPATDDALTEDDTVQHGHSKGTGVDSTVSADANKSRSSSPSPQRKNQSSSKEDGSDSDDEVAERGPKPEEPLPEDLQPSFKAIEELVEKGT